MIVTAVSTRVDFIESHEENRDSLDQRLLSWIVKLGALPVPIPNVMSDFNVCEWLNNVSPKAVILSGGNDIGEVKLRDNTENILIRHAINKGIPLLGICRGLQMVSSYFGTSLKTVDNHVRTRHDIVGDITGNVNSYHSFGIEECPRFFRIISKSVDGEIEAIRNDDLRWECWMWHPEREQEWDLTHLNRAKKVLAGEIQ